jgi:hypothetical protein
MVRILWILLLELLSQTVEMLLQALGTLRKQEQTTEAGRKEGGQEDKNSRRRSDRKRKGVEGDANDSFSVEECVKCCEVWYVCS